MLNTSTQLYYFNSLLMTNFVKLDFYILQLRRWRGRGFLFLSMGNGMEECDTISITSIVIL